MAGAAVGGLEAREGEMPWAGRQSQNIVKKVVEKAMLMWGDLLSKQSDRGLPRTHFPQGALSTDKLNCHECNGLLLLCALFMCSTLGTQHLGDKNQHKEWAEFKRMGCLGDSGMTHWIEVLERRRLPPQLQATRPDLLWSRGGLEAGPVPCRPDGYPG